MVMRRPILLFPSRVNKASSAFSLASHVNEDAPAMEEGEEEAKQMKGRLFIPLLPLKRYTHILLTDRLALASSPKTKGRRAQPGWCSTGSSMQKPSVPRLAYMIHVVPLPLPLAV